VSGPGRPAAATHLLELTGVRLAYPQPSGRESIWVLDGVDLVVAPRELVCVAGRSGSGKTSLLLIAGGFLAPSAGDVTWVGRLVDGRGSDLGVRRRGFLGVMFQGGLLIPSLTAAENVALARRADGRHAVNRQEARGVLARVGLADRFNHLPSQLSEGERQRVAVARALAAEPALLLVDEPTASLDRATADAIIAMLLDLRDQGLGLLVASHDAQLIQRADAIVRLD
jgi:predicted ABC-type transport system involved in lysophospholipase L1 biosynthesis ATPase subunit